MNAISKVKSVDDLRVLGDLPMLVSALEEDISPLKVDVSNYEELFSVVLKLRRNWVPYIKGPFVSKQQEYIYYLTKLEGKQRNVALGITDKLYEDKSAAKKWYKKIANQVHPDKGGDNAAFVVAKKLYEVMIED
ncbi:hypothetical protein [Paludibacterium paludis]|uniref:J domain-containing protein n=1 Tax=Paludibacterium paludis TaxID=1225769 RepID=A0A918UBY8_9NEIS|nr:hypothetical protein [Paludibacterium paludis]GGY29928.1 hypothetical protein GCM10011289_36000 [Paludibacterium paludis]